MKRRLMLRYAGAVLAYTSVRIVGAAESGIPFQDCNLRIVRRRGWEELFMRNRCVISDLYLAAAGFPTSDLGVKLCTALELPWRNNMKDISAIPAGSYRGAVRTDGPHGWRIELTGAAPRENVQLHVGNTPDKSKGCILPGTGESTDKSCFVSGSVAAVQKIRDAVGPDNRRPVVLLIQQG